MLTGIYQVGEYVIKKRGSIGADISDIIENPNEKGTYNHVLKITFKAQSGKLEYSGIEYEQFSMDRLLKYAYKKGSPNGGDITPTSKFTDPEKTINKISISLRDALQGSKVDETEYKQLEEIQQFINSNKTPLSNEISAKLKDIGLSSKEQPIITIVVIEDGKEKYMGDFKTIAARLYKKNDEQYYIKYGKTSKGVNTCYYCKQEKEVFGFVNTYNFYTVDKVGFVTGGLKQEYSWKNYPVCSDCSRVLNEGKKYIKSKLTSRFSGFDYSIIPKTTFNSFDDQEYMHYILRNFEENTKFTTAGSPKNNLLASEANFVEIMAETKNNINYNIMIFKEEQSGSVFRVLLFIEDIVPSKLKNILRVKEEVDSVPIFHGLPGKDESYDMKFTFEKIRNFFPNNKKEGNFDKNFLELLNNIFTYRKISYKFLLNRMMDKIREMFAREEFIENTVLQAFMNILFIEKLGLFNDKNKGVLRVMVDYDIKNSKYLEFFNEYEDTFDSDYKRAVFLCGVLAEKLMNIQYRDRGSKPFYSRLNGLKLNDKLVRRIFVEAINKLNEYDKNYYHSLEELIGSYMLGEKDITDDEISYYFALGMTLSRKFKEEREEKEDK